ncbi:MAG: glycerate kinase [Acholeplasmatales bacterium]|jgi:glycerate kinase|nr:glycerate kinase [Acholeplasmatales bacterium]
MIERVLTFITNRDELVEDKKFVNNALIKFQAKSYVFYNIATRNLESLSYILQESSSRIVILVFGDKIDNKILVDLYEKLIAAQALLYYVNDLTQLNNPASLDSINTTNRYMFHKYYRILAVLDSFKGTLSSKEVGNLLKKEMTSRGYYVDSRLVSDGGEGFLDSIEDLFKLEKIRLKVYDPTFKIINSYFLGSLKNKNAYIEMAKSCGLNLVNPEKRNPLNLSTYGLGETIKAAIDKGYKNLFIGIGGSGTNDCGMGMLEALGVKFFDEKGLELERISPKKFLSIKRIDFSSLKQTLKAIKITFLSDVTNPLLGNLGATTCYGLQKGIKKEEIENYNFLFNSINELVKRTTKKDFSSSIGSGAAGGVGYAIYSFLKGNYLSGIETIISWSGLPKSLSSYHYIISGEGTIDSYSLQGKVINGIINITKKPAKIILLCGVNELNLSNSELENLNISKIYSIVPNLANKADSISNSKKWFSTLCSEIIIN